MLDQISLFNLPVLTWPITDSWEWKDPYGVAVIEEKVTREWTRECQHPDNECAPSQCKDCGTPIGWALVHEYLARERGRQDDAE